MGKIRYYKRWVDDALNGMRGLTLEQRGAYNTVLDLIYAHDGRLLDSDVDNARFIGCDLRVWKRLKQELIDKEKLSVVSGLLMNARADRDVQEALHKLNKASEAGKASARARAGGKDRGLDTRLATPLATPQLFDSKVHKLSSEIIENNDLALTVAGETSQPSHKPLAKKERKEGVGRASRSPNPHRGTRMSEDWVPSERNRSDAKAFGLTERDIEKTHRRFRDYWLAATGKTAAKANWDATWRNWCERDADKLGRHPKVNGHGAVPVQETREIWESRLRLFKQTGNWKYEWGPEPAYSECRMPPDLIKQLSG